MVADRRLLARECPWPEACKGLGWHLRPRQLTRPRHFAGPADQGDDAVIPEAKQTAASCTLTQAEECQASIAALHGWQARYEALSTVAASSHAALPFRLVTLCCQLGS